MIRFFAMKASNSLRMMVGNEMVIRDFERRQVIFFFKKDVTGRTVLFFFEGGRKDVEEKYRRDGVSVEDTDKNF